MFDELQDRVRRIARYALGRGRGEVRLLQDLRHLREVGRFSAVFAALILAPSLLLAWISLDSSRAVESAVDLDLRQRGDSAVRQVASERAAVFDTFEANVRDRLHRGESLVGNLPELSPYLRAAFRFDSSGRLEAPFQLPDETPMPPPTPRLGAAIDRSRALEAAGSYAEAIPAWKQAIDLADGDGTHQAEARLGLARALWRTHREPEAERELDDLYAEHASLTDELGFRVGDVATLMRAEIRFSREPDVGAQALEDLVTNNLLDTRWTVGRHDGPAMTRRALALLEGHVDAEWMARTRARLNELDQELWWASALSDELEYVASPLGATDRFLYLPPSSESSSLWVQLEHGELYAFSFSTADLHADLAARAAQIKSFDRDLLVLVTESGAEPPEEALAATTLGPQLPSVAVYAVPADPTRLAGLKDSRRTQRAAVVVLATFLVGVGVILAARIVGREVETARMKADFAANVSHELRSPITQIRLKGEALQLGLTFDEADTRAHYDAIVAQSEQLSRLVDNVLDFAAIERGVKKYQLRPSDLGDVIHQAIESTRPAMDERGIALEVSIEEDLPVIWMDRDAMGQVVANLLSNAIKYGSAGKWIGVSARSTGDQVELAVSDRGMGIAPRDLSRVFEHFFRSEDPKVRKMKGTGIGLTIVRYIVEAHGGTIAVDSEPGHGATFTVQLPVESPESA